MAEQKTEETVLTEEQLAAIINEKFTPVIEALKNSIDIKEAIINLMSKWGTFPIHVLTQIGTLFTQDKLVNDRITELYNQTSKGENQNAGTSTQV